jgi:hypothetical protein
VSRSGADETSRFADDARRLRQKSRSHAARESNVRSIVAVVLMLVSYASFAETKTPIFFMHNGEDELGKQLAYRIKEEIRKSSTLELKRDTGGALVSALLMTMPHNAQRPNDAVSYTIVVTARDLRTDVAAFRDTKIGIAGATRIESSEARDIVWLTEVIEEAVQDQAKWAMAPCLKTPTD